ncbi:MAG: radical SAM protein [Candidatus Undinarchaeales archaeon]|nr:radical SAM protein [Candidatus Undinarchaeales archaeon]MDP7493202.1 radical SAM protein [Candidatus Undinarchaeales archaeon]
MDTLREVQSVCPVCCDPVDAVVRVDDEGVYMEKTCPEHGDFSVVLSRHPQEYRELYRFFTTLIWDLPEHSHDSYIFYITPKCNMACPICFTRASAGLWDEPSLKFIKEKMDGMQGKRISLFGGEPTVRDDLPEIVRVIRDTGNVPVLFTNGKAIAEMSYLRSLTEAGLHEVHLQFDGFDDDVYRTMRECDMATIKRRTLENLCELGIPTVLEATIARGLNEDEIPRIIDYAVEHPFVRGIAIKSYVEMGSAGLDHSKSLRGDELLDIFAEQTDGRISNGTILQFHKLLYSLFNIISQRWCSNEYLFFLLRDRDGKYSTINEVLELDGLEPALERFRDMRERGSWLATPYFLTRAIAHSLRPRTLGLLLNVASLALGILLRRPLRAFHLSPRIIFLEIGALCNPDNFEYERARRCSVHQLTTKGTVGMCLGNMARERRIRSMARKEGDTLQGSSPDPEE